MKIKVIIIGEETCGVNTRIGIMSLPCWFLEIFLWEGRRQGSDIDVCQIIYQRIVILRKLFYFN